MSNFALPQYTVYFDTNAAFSPKPAESISPKLLEALAQVRRLTGLAAKMPAVVMQELCYQKTKVALQAMENQTKNAETIKQICGIAPPPVPDLPTLKAACHKRLLECLKQHSIAVVEAPIEKINWQGVIESACWRIPPFEKPKTEDDLAEKGFRDCIILESIVHDAADVKTGQIAVLSKDKIFTDALKARTKSMKPSLELYDDGATLLSQVKLLNETKSGQLAAAVQRKVGSVFYNPDDPNCVVFAHSLLEKLKADYDESLSRPSILSLFKPDTATFSDWLAEMTEWSPVSDLKISANAPEFVNVDRQGRYHWKSELTLARLLRRSHAGNRYYPITLEKIRLQKVTVLWSVHVDPNNAEFSGPKLDDIQPSLGDDFLDATLELRTTFGFPLTAGLDPD